MDHMDFNEEKSTNGVGSFRQTPYKEETQLNTPRVGRIAFFDVVSNNLDEKSAQLTPVNSSTDSNNNNSLDDNVNSPLLSLPQSPSRDLSNDRASKLLVDGVIPMLLRAPKKRHAVQLNVENARKIRRRPSCGKNLFGRGQDGVISDNEHEIIYNLEPGVTNTSSDEESCKLSHDECCSVSEVHGSEWPLVCVPLQGMSFSSQRNFSNNSDVDNRPRADDISNSGSQTACDNSGEDCNNVPDRSDEDFTDFTSDEEDLIRQGAGTPPRFPVSNDGNSSPNYLAEDDSDAEYERPRLLPEHYVAPRRQRRLPFSIRSSLASMRTRRLSFNMCEDESNDQQVMPEGPDLQLSFDASSLYTPSFCAERRLSNQNTRRRLFDNDKTSLRKSFYTLILPNPSVSNRIDVATVQSILNTVLGDNNCPQQSRQQRTSFSDDSEDLASSDDDCSVSYGNSDHNSSDEDCLNDNDSSDEEYWRAASGSVCFLPKSQLSVFDSDSCTSSLYLEDEVDNENLGNCVAESSSSDTEATILFDSADESCDIVSDSAEETFLDLCSSEDDTRNHASNSPSLTPVTTHTRNHLRCTPEEDSDAEYHHQRPHSGRCAAPRRQRPASRRARFALMCRRRLSFNDCNEDTDNEGATSEDSSVVSQSDCSIRSHLIPDNNKYLYALAPSHNHSGKSKQVDIASIQSILNSFFNPPSCDTWSSSQSNMNTNSSSETQFTHSLTQSSLVANSPRLSNNESNNSEESMKTESPSAPLSPGHSEPSLHQDMSP